MQRNKMYKLSEEARKDIKWWYLFLPGFSGMSILWLLDVIQVDAEMAVDACLQGAGGVSGKECYRVSFPHFIKSPNIGILHYELWVVIIAVRIWGSKFKGKVIRVRSDNEAVSIIINTGRSKDKMLQKLLRELMWWMAIYEFKIKSVHIMGKINKLPDLLSRWTEGPEVRQEFERQGGKDLVVKPIDKKFFKFMHEW